jgi:DNA-binding NarL/FixJ family response regulator
LEGLAEIAQAQGRVTYAVQLLSAVQIIRATSEYYSTFGSEQPSYNRTLAEIRARLDGKSSAAVGAVGPTPEQAIAAETAKAFHTQDSVVPSVMPQPVSAPVIPNELTAREVEVLRLVAMGLTNSQIAEQLVLSPNTVNAHTQSIYRKIDVNSRSAATRFAMEHQLV